ncbi:MAG: hypothetical protein M9952_12830 [Microthrixaceae bacterium]|nr:hypothetical protein [Microthrixaceae bacterium]
MNRQPGDGGTVDAHDLGGDPPCWAHLFDDEEDEDGDDEDGVADVGPAPS